MTGSAPSDASQRSHYRVLGVEPSAGPDEIRRAHRQLARVLHPDRLAAAPPAERRFAERRMREVNAAWTVLSDPERRRAYDRSLRVATNPTSRPATATRSGGGAEEAPHRSRSREDWDDEPVGTVDVLDDEEPLPGWYFWLLRRGPIVAALVLAVGIFVFTAYAGTAGDDSPATTAVEAELCARIVDPVDRRAVLASCTGPNDGTVVTTVEIARKCPAGTRYVVVASSYVCVDGEPRDG